MEVVPYTSLECFFRQKVVHHPYKGCTCECTSNFIQKYFKHSQSFVHTFFTLCYHFVNQ